jgi:hypothetical protein
MLYISKAYKGSKASLYQLASVVLSYLKPCTKTIIAYSLFKSYLDKSKKLNKLNKLN